MTNKKMSTVVTLLTTMVLTMVVNVVNAEGRQLEAESAVVTKHSTKVKGKQFSYTATAGTQPVWDKKGEVIASLFYR
ncbi:unnamed protein product, partial [marine sediment metagenome]